MLKLVVAAAMLAVVSGEAPSYGAPGALSNSYGAPGNGAAPASAYAAPRGSGISNSYGAPSASSALGNSYGAPAGPSALSNAYGAPGAVGPSALSNSYGAPSGLSSSSSGIPSQAYGAGLLGAGRNSGINDGPIESEPNLELENEGANLPSDIVGQELLDRVVDAVSQDLAQQEAARAAAAAAQSSAYGAPVYGPPSGAYGAPGGAAGGRGGPGSLGNGGRIMLLIPPDPLKARLIANYIQRGTRPLSPEQLAALEAASRGGYNGGNDLLGGGSASGYSGAGRNGY